MQYRHWAGIGAAIILGVIFVIAGLAKIPAQILPNETAAYMILLYLSRVPLLQLLSDHIDVLLPSVEIALGLLLALGIATRITAIFSSVLIGIFIFNNAWMINEGMAQEPCYCFAEAGFISTQQALYMDIGMLALVLVAVFCYSGSWLTVRPWFLRRDETARC